MRNGFHKHLSPGQLRRAVSATLLAFGLIAGSAQAGTTATPALDALLDEGRRIYLEGRDAQGQPLQATLSQGQALQGAGVACVSCHQRSGQGGLEGQVLMPPVTGPSLFHDGVFSVAGGLPTERDKGWLAPRYQTRHAYTPASLQAALLAGRDPDGRELHDPMPRYALDAQAQAAVLAYLQQLGAEPLAGPQQAPLFWVVLTAGADPRRRDAVQQVLQAYAAALPPPALPWRLRVLDLSRQPDALAQALQVEGGERPLAVLGGAGADDWAAVQAQCEAHALPCLLPSLAVPPPLPDAAQPRRYSVYWSEGLVLEARALAQLVREDTHASCRNPLLLALSDRSLADRTPAGQAATARTRIEAATPAGDTSAGPPIVEAEAYLRGLQALRDGLPNAAVLRIDAPSQAAELTALQAAGAACVVAWLPQGALQAAFVAAGAPDSRGTAAPAWWMAQGLLPMHGLQVPAVWKPHVTMVSSLDAQAPLRLRSQLLPWLQGHGIADVDLRVAADAYGAAGLMQAALTAMEAERIRGMRVGFYSREELLETLDEVSAHARTPAVPHFSPLRIGGVSRVAARNVVSLRYAGVLAPEPTLQRRWVPQ